MGVRYPLRGMLFDLDGTLLDTAGDLIAACNTAAAEAGLQPVASVELRPRISGGAGAMLGRILELQPPSAIRCEQEVLVERMLTLYESNIAVHTRLFAGMDQVIATLEARAIPWGIVTNKLERFTTPLLRQLNTNLRPMCVISGDTLSERKPHPLPMLEACRQLGCAPELCVYLGDARGDIEAGRRAGMATLAASYGYVDRKDPVESWGADAVIGHPLQLLDCLNRRGC
ncbi:MAG: HAD-IA family hydrolase [Methylococcaceae bacterium]|nr:HAD-IA family hydrolase [Methylococcaceae bacterium]